MAQHDDEQTPLLTNANIDTIRADGDSYDLAPKDPGDPANLSTSKIATILSATWLGVFLVALDTTIVATLVGPISSSFQSSNQISWLGTSYLLTLATTTPLCGKLSDIIGRRYACLVSLSFFATGTSLCGLANSMPMLIAARALAGCGGGGIIATIVASDIIPLKKRGLIQGIVNIFYGLGGFIAAKYYWRFAFLIQVPFIGLAWILVFIFVRYTVPGQVTSKKAAFKKIDWLGCLSLIVCISCFLLSLSFKNNFSLPWSDPKVWVNMLLFACFLGVFVGVEAKVSPNPVMPLRILSHWSPICIAWSNFTFSAMQFSFLYYYPLFFEIVQNAEPGEAGLHLIPNAIALSVGSLTAGYVMRRTGKYYYLNLFLAFIPVIGNVMMARMDETPRWTDWLNPFPHGVGAGGNVVAVLIALLANVDRSDMAVATGISYLFRYCGQVFGVGLSGGVLQAILAAQLHKRISGPGSEALIDQIRKATSSIPHLEPEIRIQAVESYKVALRWVFYLIASMGVVNFLISIPIEEYPLPGSFEEENVIRDQRRGENGESAPVEES